MPIPTDKIALALYGAAEDNYTMCSNMNGAAYAASEEIERLRRLLQWCRPRLRSEAYRIALDVNLASPREPDSTPVVQS